ncbi:MAG: hypothetical protein ACLUGY_19975 [Phocaeicola massiliensis]
MVKEQQETDCGSGILPTQDSYRKSLHLSGCTTSECHTAYYKLKDKKPIFQRPFMAESGKKFSAKRFFNLSQTFFHSQPNEMKPS